jgi:hypothetical protein
MSENVQNKPKKRPVLGFMLLVIFVGVVAVLAYFNFSNPLENVMISLESETDGSEKVDNDTPYEITTKEESEKSWLEENVLGLISPNFDEDTEEAETEEDTSEEVAVVEEELTDSTVPIPEPQPEPVIEETLQPGLEEYEVEAPPIEEEYETEAPPVEEEYVRTETVRIRFSGPSLIENGDELTYRYLLNLNSAGAKEFSVGINYEIQKSTCANTSASGFSGLISNPKSGDNVIDITVNEGDLVTKYDTQFVDYIFETVEDFLVIDGDIGIPVCK